MANTKTVLIVDGSSSDRGNVAAFLEDYYNVIDTGSTSEAYGILNVDHKNIGAVILDITSDGTYGEEMLNFMKKEENLSNIPVIMTADTESEETEISALSAGASDFLYKPYRCLPGGSFLPESYKASGGKPFCGLCYCIF